MRPARELAREVADGWLIDPRFIDRLAAAIDTRDREAEAREAGLRTALKRITGPCSSQGDGSSACDKPQPWDGKIYDPESWCFKCIARNALAGTRAGMRR